MSSEGARTEISPRMQAVARLAASVLAGLVTFAVVTLALPDVGWEIAREPAPFQYPVGADGDEQYFNEYTALLVFLVTYTVLSFWAAME